MKPSPDITWVVEYRGVTLFGPREAQRLSIPYPYAGLWALIANGNFSLPVAADLLGVLLAVPKPQAERAVLDALDAWTLAGLVTET